MNSKRKKIMILLSITLFCSLLLSTQAYAITDDEIKRVLETFPDFFITNNFLSDAGRYIAWQFVKGLTWLAEQCTTLYHTALGFVDFTTYSGVENYIRTLKGVFTAILAVSICGLGITLIIDHEKKPKILKSLFVMGIAISASSFLLTTLSTAVKKDAMSITSDKVVISDVVNSSLYDLLYIDRNCGGLANMNKKNLENYHYKGNVDVNKVDINEVINYNSDQVTTEDAKKILSKKTLYVHTTGDDYEVYLQDVYNGFGWNTGDDDDFFNEFYYRYKVDYFYIYLNLLAICIVYICMSYKVIRIIFEIVTGRIMAILYSANVNGVQKTVKILESIMNGYIVLLLTAVLIKLFNYAQLFLKDMIPYDDYPVANCLLLLFLAFSVIDGPNIIQQITGIDAGLSSGVGKMIAGYHMMKEAGHTVHSIKNAGANVYRKAASLGHNQSSQEVSLNGGDNHVVPPSSEKTTDNSMKKNSDVSESKQSFSSEESQNSTGNNIPPSGSDESSSNGNNSNDNLMAEMNLDEHEPSSLIKDDGKSDMVDLSSNPSEISPNSMADEMNRALNSQYKGTEDMNGTSGLGVHKPVDVAADNWKQYDRNSFVDLSSKNRSKTNEFFTEDKPKKS